MDVPVTRTIYDRISVAPPRNIARYLQVIRLILILSIVSFPFWLTALFFTSAQDHSIISSLICIPILAIAGTIAIVHSTQNDPYLRRLLSAGLIAHMAAASVFLWVGLFIYGGVVDAFHYWTVGWQIAQDFQIIGWAAFQAPYWSTNLIYNICGLAVLLIGGDAMPTIFIAFALVPLAGGYLFYRAFTIAFPTGDRWLFGLLVVLSPSLLFWSSFVGKDALIQYFIALTCYGFARLTQHPSPKSTLICVAGLAGVLLVRAHVASMLAMAITFPYIAAKSRSASAKAAKIVLIPILAGCTYFLIKQASSFIDFQTDSSASIFQQADMVTRNSQIGGSAFNEKTSLPLRIAESPFLLIRPFPWEMRSWITIPPALESVGWLLLCWYRRREIWATLRHWRDPYVSFLLMYSAVFAITFGGSISNFGILLRQRIMMTPLVLMLICAKQKTTVPGVPRIAGRNVRPTHTAGIPQPDHIPTGA